MVYWDILMLEFLFGIFWSLVWGFATAAVREKKGYGRNWFWFGFFLGIVPFIIACAIPGKEYYGPGEFIELPQTYQEPERSLFLSEDEVSKTLAAGGWQCVCGRANMQNVSTCACGMSKRDRGSNAAQERRKKLAENRKKAESELKKYQVMYESHLISEEEYRAAVSELRRQMQ